MTKAEKTQAYIIERTAPLFNAKGYAGTLINDLMEITGLTKGSIMEILRIKMKWP